MEGPSMRKLPYVRKRTLVFALGIFFFMTLIPAMETYAVVAVDSTVRPLPAPLPNRGFEA
jgi:hypothetical protein